MEKSILFWVISYFISYPTIDGKDDLGFPKVVYESSHQIDTLSVDSSDFDRFIEIYSQIKERTATQDLYGDFTIISNGIETNFPNQKIDTFWIEKKH